MGPVTSVMVAMKLQEEMMVLTRRRGNRVEFLLDQLLKENGVQKE
jgi:uncharacterized protein with PIN domain